MVTFIIVITERDVGNLSFVEGWSRYTASIPRIHPSAGSVIAFTMEMTGGHARKSGRDIFVRAVNKKNRSLDRVYRGGELRRDNPASVALLNITRVVARLHM